MGKKGFIVPALTMVCALAGLALSITTLASVNRDCGVEELRTENAALSAQVEDLTRRLEVLEQGDGLAGWSLTPAAAEDGSAVNVTMTATPAGFVPGMTAEFSVHLDAMEITTLPGEAMGQSFTATAPLPVKDGYSYYCTLIQPDGTRKRYSLSSPENPIEGAAVYLATSMESFCSVLVDSWEQAGSELVLTSAYLRIQLPMISRTGQPAALEKADLVLMLNGEESARLPVSLNPAEGEGNYELSLISTRLPLPETETDDQLDLLLEVSLSDGSTLSTTGATWFAGEDALSFIAG